MTQIQLGFNNIKNADINEEDIPELIADEGSPEAKKPKKNKIPIDRRIELTDEELKVSIFLKHLTAQLIEEPWQDSRAKYVEEQRAIRLEHERKRLERQGLKALEDQLWSVPESCECFLRWRCLLSWPSQSMLLS